MKSLLAFIKKEFLEQFRGGKLFVLGILFILFGVMNPAIAKLTPWLFEVLADSLAENGMIVTTVEVTAMHSWTQFFKNIPMGLIVFILLESGIFTKEYQTGTLVLSLTKGLERYKIVISKTIVLVTLWTVCYWLCFLITYSYNAYFWDNSTAQNLVFSAICWWLFGLWTIALQILFSTITKSNTGVLIGTGGAVFGFYLLGLFSKLKTYMPTLLMDGNSLIYGVTEAKTYVLSLSIAVIVTVVCFVVSIPIFNKKKL